MVGVLKRAGDLVYTFRFLKLLITSFDDTEAYKLGLIDDKGKRIKKAETSDERAAYTPFHRLVFNIKKLIAKAPGGSTKIASYAAALYLLKEKFNVTDKQLKEAIQYAGLDPLDFIAENTQWFVLEDKRLSPGSYKVLNDKMINSTLDEVVYKRDSVTVGESCYPVGDVFGLDVYEVTHSRTRQPIYVTIGELAR